MQLLELTLPSIADNLALDEALLLQADEASEPREVLRLWEPHKTAVVLGRACRVADEVNLFNCEQSGVDVVRRTSGGGTIVTGSGCLMYSVVLSLQLRPALVSVDVAHCLVLETIAKALQPFAPGAARRGTSDLAAGDLKFSGNSMRVKRTHLLYHGTVLYDFPLQQISDLLKPPPRQPDYRLGRTHEQFVQNLEATVDQLKQSLITAWQPTSTMTDWPREEVQQLVAERYSQRSWNHRH